MINFFKKVIFCRKKILSMIAVVVLLLHNNIIKLYSGVYYAKQNIKIRRSDRGLERIGSG